MSSPPNQEAGLCRECTANQSFETYATAETDEEILMVEEFLGETLSAESPDGGQPSFGGESQGGKLSGAE